ncbi:MAG: hypothetical protein RBG13Loki_2680 [Promethearchaeota archaeon CR_4]|nr:MAG: hypothetical protein RBG13Loki_2680 [Candidatus Lokiarchaeota archaeon CR_4]
MIEITVDPNHDKCISEAEIRQFVENIATTYDTRPIQTGNTYRIETDYDGKELKGIGLMTRFYETFHDTFRNIVEHMTKVTKSRGRDGRIGGNSQNSEEKIPRKAIFSAQITTPLIAVHVPFIEAVNLLFAQMKFGFYMEVIQEGFVFYVDDKRGFDFIARFFSADIYQYVRENETLLQSNPTRFFNKILEMVGFG